MAPEQKYDEADAFARDFADRHAGTFRMLRRALDIMIVGLVGALLLGKVGMWPIFVVIVLRLMPPMRQKPLQKRQPPSMVLSPKWRTSRLPRAPVTRRSRPSLLLPPPVTRRRVAAVPGPPALALAWTTAMTRRTSHRR